MMFKYVILQDYDVDELARRVRNLVVSEGYKLQGGVAMTQVQITSSHTKTTYAQALVLDV